MINCNDIRESITQINPDAIIWDAMDDAIVGISDDGRVVYDINKIEHLIYDKDNMTLDEAVEWVNFNMVSAHLGEFTPIHIWKIPTNDE